MKTKNTAAIFLAFLLGFSCSDEDKTFSPIAGTWKGTLAEVRIKPFGLPIPISREDENFSSLIEFRSDGTLTFSQGIERRDGTYDMTGKTITTDLHLSMEGVDLPDTYTIEELTDTHLVFYAEKSDTFTDPDSGRSVSGDIKVTLHFQRL